MALVVETGEGLANAESYASLAEIGALLALTGEDAAWLAVAGGDTGREQIARKATRMLDTEYQFRGRKKTQEQALEWPRFYARDDDGWLYSDTALPPRVKEALAQLCAAGAVVGADLQPTLTQPGELKSKSLTVGKISISKTFAGVQSQEVYYRKAESLLSELVEDSAVVERA